MSVGQNCFSDWDVLRGETRGQPPAAALRPSADVTPITRVGGKEGSIIEGLKRESVCGTLVMVCRPRVI